MHEKRQTGANNNRSQLKDLVHFTLTFSSFVINFFFYKYTKLSQCHFFLKSR